MPQSPALDCLRQLGTELFEQRPPLEQGIIMPN
jgi:hypothetical protein